MASFWHDIPTQLWHTAVLYAVAFLVLRLMGKRSVGQLAPFDVVVVIMIGEPVMTLFGIKCFGNRRCGPAERDLAGLFLCVGDGSEAPATMRSC